MISTISVTVPFTEENLKILSQLTPVTENGDRFKVMATDTAEAQNDSADKPAAKPKTEQKPEPKKSAEPEKVTKTDVRALALKLSKAGKTDEISSIFGNFGASKLSDISEDKYPELKIQLESAVAKLNG